MITVTCQYHQKFPIQGRIPYGVGSTGAASPASPLTPPIRVLPLAFLCPLPKACVEPSLLSLFALLGPADPFTTPLLVAECGAFFAEFGNLALDSEGEGEDVEEFMPFVCMPGGTGRLILAGSACVVAVTGAMLRSADYALFPLLAATLSIVVVFLFWPWVCCCIRVRARDV